MAVPSQPFILPAPGEENRQSRQQCIEEQPVDRPERAGKPVRIAQRRSGGVLDGHEQIVQKVISTKVGQEKGGEAEVEEGGMTLDS